MRDIEAIFADGRLVDLALRRAVRRAIRDHQRAGLAMVEWRDGKTVWVKPWKVGRGRKVRAGRSQKKRP